MWNKKLEAKTSCNDIAITHTCYDCCHTIQPLPCIYFREISHTSCIEMNKKKALGLFVEHFYLCIRNKRRPHQSLHQFMNALLFDDLCSIMESPCEKEAKTTCSIIYALMEMVGGSVLLFRALPLLPALALTPPPPLSLSLNHRFIFCVCWFHTSVCVVHVFYKHGPLLTKYKCMFLWRSVFLEICMKGEAVDSSQESKQKRQKID